jgi:hypothetical protein
MGDDLVQDDKIPPLDLLLERPDGAERDDTAHTNRVEHSNAGTVGNLVECEGVMESVPGQEGDRDLVCMERDWRWRRSPRSIYVKVATSS